jgi:hypothetical protein
MALADPPRHPRRRFGDGNANRAAPPWHRSIDVEIQPQLRHMTEFVTKRPKRLRCLQCHKRFTAPQRGRPPRYCSPSCRQRAYEKRRAASQVEAQLPLRLLARDIAAVQGQDEFRRRVVEVLRELRLLPPAPHRPPRSPLRVVKDSER